MSNNSRNLERGIKESDQQQLPIIVCKAQLQGNKTPHHHHCGLHRHHDGAIYVQWLARLGASSKAATVRVSFH
jgi:hypothetical protein